MSRSISNDEKIGFLLIGMLLSAVLYPILYYIGVEDCRTEAVRNNAAAYNRKGEFVWLDGTKKVETEPYIGFLDE